MSAPTGQSAAPPPPPRRGAAPAEPESSAARTTVRVWVIVTAVVIGLALLAFVVAAFTSTVGRDDDQPSAAGPRIVSGPIEGRNEARFELVSGAETVTVRSADLGEDLYRVETPAGGSLLPKANSDGDRVRVLLENTGAAGPASVDIQLSTKVRWQLTLAGGGLRQVVDFGGGRLTAVEFTAGSSEIAVTAPAPDGTLVIRLTAGAGQFVAHVAGGAPAQVRVGGGAGTVTVDGTVHNGLAGGTVLTPSGWDQARNRYDIDLMVGVSTVTVDRR